MIFELRGPQRGSARSRRKPGKTWVIEETSACLCFCFSPSFRSPPCPSTTLISFPGTAAATSQRAYQTSTTPRTCSRRARSCPPIFRLRLYPLTLERSALLAQYEVEERYSIEYAQVAYDEELKGVEDERRRGRERVRERLLEGIEERRPPPTPHAGPSGGRAPPQQHKFLRVCKPQRQPLVKPAYHDRPLPQSSLPFRR